MEAEINNEFQIFFSEESQSDSTIRCHLSPEISAVDMEIRWFKETDCVCFYKNRRLIEGESYKGIMSLCIEELERGIVSLQLKDVRESYVGDYLCQVTRGDRTAEITIRKCFPTALKTHEDQNDMSQQITTPWTKQFEKTWTDEERIKMVNSALLAVFNSLEKTNPRKEDLQGINATVLQTDINIEENQNETHNRKQYLQESIIRPMNESVSFSGAGVLEMETSTCKPEEQETKPVNKIFCLGNQQPGCSSHKLLDSDVKVCIIRTGKTKNYDKDFTDILQSRIENLTEVPSVGKSDIILVFCPVVSRAGTDIDKALERFTGKTETKLGVLVVLHHTFDPEKVIPDSSRCVSRTDILTVDCVFNEDTGLLKCQKNSDTVDKVMNWLLQQGNKAGVKIRPRQRQIQHLERKELNIKNIKLSIKRQKTANNEPSTIHFPEKVKVFSILAGKIKNCHKEFFTILRNRIENLKEGLTADESDIILVFCPIVSRAGTDIEAALNNFIYSSGSKLTVLVVLHHTFDPEKTVPDSRRCVSRTDILTVDCVFYEDTGLLKCQKNSDAADKTVNWLIQQGAKRGITLSPCQCKSSSLSNVFTSMARAWTVGLPKQKSNVQEMTYNSSRPVDYFIHVTKDTSKCDVDFIDALHKLVPLRNVPSVQESEIILLFSPVCSPSDVNTTLLEYHKRPDKPAVIIFLHETLVSNSVPNSSGCVKSQDVLVVDCIFCDGEGLPDCKKNREAISAVADWIKKFRDH